MSDSPSYEIVVIATSLGGLAALTRILLDIPPNFSCPIVVLQHRKERPEGDDLLVQLLDDRVILDVQPASQGVYLQAGTVYVAPPGRHIRVEKDRRIHLSDEVKIGLWRPAADELLRTVAASYREAAICVILTGKLFDGAKGAMAIQAGGGTVLAQDEASSEAFAMPRAAIATGAVNRVLPLNEIGPALCAMVMPDEPCR